MKMVVYQAMLANPNNVARVRAAQRDIERVGGKVSVTVPTPAGMVIVLLHLPETYRPEQFLPGLPFYAT